MMTSFNIPSSMKAIVVQADKTVTVQDVPVPEIADDEILVKTIAVAQNPTDWKHVDFVTNPGTILGVDYSGEVVKLGNTVTSGLVIGDHVAGCTHGGYYTDRGAFAEYVKTPAELVWKVPEGTLTYEEAATLGCGFWTAIQGLFHPTRLGLVEPPGKTEHREWIFIYGGSTSVGQFAIQLAHLSGYKVVTVSSPKNFSLVKSLGADAVFDYKDPDVVEKIKEVTKNDLHIGLDTISEASTQQLTVKTFGSGPGKLILILGIQKGVEELRPDVKIQSTLLYTVLGLPFHLGRFHEASPADRKHMADFLKKVPGLVKDGLIKPNPIKLWPGGLHAIKDGLQYMREGKVRGEKIVYRIV